MVQKFLGFLDFLLQCFRAGLKIMGLQKTEWQGLKVKLVLMKCPRLAGLAMVFLAYL